MFLALPVPIVALISGGAFIYIPEKWMEIADIMIKQVTFMILQIFIFALPKFVILLNVMDVITQLYKTFVICTIMAKKLKARKLSISLHETCGSIHSRSNL